MKPRYAAKVDDNEKEIIRALESIGCTVYRLGVPVDLLVGYRSRNFLIDVKNPDTDYGRNDRGTEAQRQFFRDWRGQVRKAWTADEAVALVTDSYGGEGRASE